MIRPFIGPPPADSWEPPAPPEDAPVPDLSVEAVNTSTQQWRVYVDDWREDDRLHGRIPVADDEQLDTDLIDRQYTDLAEVNAGLSRAATAHEVAAAHPRRFARHPLPRLEKVPS